MSRIKGKDTSPEMVVRRHLFSMGYRYRLHDKKLPGAPDIVFRKDKAVVFVNGCFWHMHANCANSSVPKTNTEFWKNKLENNAKRDEQNYQTLLALGWRVRVVWECELRNPKVRGSVLCGIVDWLGEIK